MDTKFSVAVHTLILVSVAPGSMTSEQIAASVGTNPSYIRKIITLLRNAGLVTSRRGVSGCVLTALPEAITLLQIYTAVMDGEQTRLLDIHRNPNDRCIVGRNIKPVLSEMFCEAESAFLRVLSGKTLADCINAMHKRMNIEEDIK